MIAALAVVVAVLIVAGASAQHCRRKVRLVVRARETLDGEVERRRRLIPELASTSARDKASQAPADGDLAVSEQRIAAAWRWYASAYADYKRVASGFPGRWWTRLGVMTAVPPAAAPDEGPLKLGLGMASCPTCGAPLQLDDEDRCPYCGTELLRAV